MSEDKEGIVVPTVKSGEGLRRLAEQTSPAPKEGAFDLKTYQDRLKTQVFLKLEEGLKTPEGVKIREEIELARRRDAEASLFNLITGKLREFIDSPNPDLEAGLKDARQILIDAGKEAGVFGDKERGPKYALRKAQETDDWEVANKEVEGLNVGAMEHDATDRLERRSPDFALMPTEYVRIARLNMDYSMLIAQGKGSSDKAKRIQREIHLLGWGNPPPLLDQAVDYLKRKARAEMPEKRVAYEEPPTQPSRGREAYAQPALLPPEYGAVFESSKYRQYARDAFLNADVVPVLDILKSEDRTQWLFENMRVFADGTTASPESRWHMILDTWLSDLKSSTTRHFTAAEEEVKNSEDAVRQQEEMGREVQGEIRAAIAAEKRKIEEDRGKSKEIVETEKLLKAAVAVSASARSMEQSGGVAARYAINLAPPGPGDEGPDIDKQDSWQDILIHNNPEAYGRVIKNPLVEHYYQKLLIDARIKIDPQTLQEPKAKGTRTITGKFKMKDDAAKNPLEIELVDYLRSEEGYEYKGGFDAWIADTIVNDGVPPEEGDSVKWAAAKLACDAFLIDKFTKWEEEVDPQMQLKMAPFAGWGGNPLRAVIDPSALPRRFKGMYKAPEGIEEEVLGIEKEIKAVKLKIEEATEKKRVGVVWGARRRLGKLEARRAKLRGQGDWVILNMLDDAFHPTDLFEGQEDSMVQPSMVGHLKDFYRYSDALWKVLGGSRSDGIPVWSRKFMEEHLSPVVVKNIDTVYGKGQIGKERVGMMIARILEMKALASVMESRRPNLQEKLRLLLDPEDRDRPHVEVAQFLYGPKFNGRAGFFASLASGRQRIVFRHNRYGAERLVEETKQLLLSNEQSAKGRRAMKSLLWAGWLTVDLSQTLDKYFGKGGGRRQS